jgi:hypothetical protein
MLLTDKGGTSTQYDVFQLGFLQNEKFELSD